LLTIIALAGALLATPQAPDKWDIRAALASKMTTTWSVNADVVDGGESHSAALKVSISFKEPEQDKPQKATYEWKQLVLDGGEELPDFAWDVTLDPMGGIVDSDHSDGAEAIRLMLMPMTFVYPDKPVGVGDTWTDTLKVGASDANTMTFEMKAEAIEKVGEVDALKVTETLSQKGADALGGKSIWWVGKDGKVLKMEAKISNWAVPMNGGSLMEATFKANLEK
jgi:hypothetical protein